MKNDELLHKWINKTITNQELNEFKLRPEYDSLVDLYQQTENLTGPEGELESVLQNILNSPKQAPGQKTITQSNQSKPEAKTRLFPSWLKYGVAACFLIVSGFLFWPKDNVVSYMIADNQQLEGTLPDKSTFVLSGDSQLSYDSKSWQGQRDVELKGNAFFNVEKGSTFTVNTDNGLVRVLGTQFNVQSKDKSLTVSCSEGKVSVESNSKNLSKEILEAGEHLVFNDGNSITWKNDLTKFKNVPLAEVLKELENQFNIQIKRNQIDTLELLSCNFQKENLELALKTTLSPLDISFEIESNNVVNLIK